MSKKARLKVTIKRWSRRPTHRNWLKLQKLAAAS